MKKRDLLLIILFLNVILLANIYAQDLPSISDNVPGGGLINNIKVDETTGEIEKLSEFQEKIEEFRGRDGNENKTLVWKSWWIIFKDNPVVGPGLFYTEKFIGFFNPVWKYSFGIEFIWALVFFLHLFLWLIITAFIAIPIYQGKLMGLIPSVITGAIVASITGTFGVLTNFVKVLETALTSLLFVTIFFGFTIILIILYAKIFDYFRKGAEKEELAKSKAKINLLGRIVDKFFKSE